MKYIPISILCLTILVSCNNNKLNSSLHDVSIIIDLKDTKWIDLDSIAKKRMTYIPLETNSRCIIGEANKVLIRNNRIYVADFTLSYSLFVFDMQGKYLFKIDKRGKGPGEYINFKDFDILSNGDICLWDVDLCKFLIYDNSGCFKQDMRMKYRLSFFCSVNNHFYFSEIFDRGKMTVNLSDYDINRDEYHHLIMGRGELDNNLVNYSFYKFHYSPHKVYYTPRFSEIIYSIDTTGVHPAIGITGLPVPPMDVIKQWGFQNTLMLDDTNYLKDIVFVHETDRYISIQCEIGLFLNLLYDKKSKKCYRLNPLFKTIGIPHIQGSTGDNFFGIMPPDKEYLGHIIDGHDVLSHITEDSNPIVVLFNFDI